MTGQSFSYNDFIGREFEINELRALLEKPYMDKRILFIYGAGGVGKTMLVKRMLSEAREFIALVSEEPIDLFSTDYRHIDGIQKKIKDIIENLTELRDEVSPFKEWKNRQTSDKFYDCLKKFCETQVLVLAFDTVENLDKVTSDWIFRSEQGGLQVPGLICIVAGRDKEIDNFGEYIQNPLVRHVSISGFTFEETEEFYQRLMNKNELSGIDRFDEVLAEADLLDSNRTLNSLEWIRKVTYGHPLKLEMAFQWLDTLLLVENLASLTPDKFEERLMMCVRELGERGLLDVGTYKVSRPLYDTLLCMSYVTRRFDKGFLRYLVERKIIHLDAASGVNEAEVLETLEKYFFVKVRSDNSDNQIIQLHDEMARLVREYVWPYLDNSFQRKQDLLDAVAQYYEQLIAEQKGDTDILQIERLYYTFQKDWEESGMKLWFELSESGNENIKKLLPGEIKDYIDRYDVDTRVKIHARIADIERNAYHISQAMGHWSEVEKLGKETSREEWVVDALVGKFNCTWMTDPELALTEYLQPAREICERSFKDRLAFLYYEIGFAHHQMQNLEETVNWYEKALRQCRESPDNPRLHGILFNDAGYAYLQLGQWGYATQYLKQALEIRTRQLHNDDAQIKMASEETLPDLRARRSESAWFVGLSRNTLGEFHRFMGDLDEAFKDYSQAYKIFDEENNYFWQAKCLCARGETYRRLARGEWQDNGVNSEFEKYYQLAQGDIEKSLYLCEKFRLDDERDTPYRRLGRLYHDLAMISFEKKNLNVARQNLETAYDYFMKGLAWARKTKDVLEELENLTELAFLADDAVEIFEGNEPDHYHGAVKELELGLKSHEDDHQRIYLFPVFQYLLKMEQAALDYADGDYDKALDGYLDAFKGLGMSPGYGHARYKQHFNHLVRQVENLPKEKFPEWREKFVTTWMETPATGQEGKYLVDILTPDLVTWFNERK